MSWVPEWNTYGLFFFAVSLLFVLIGFSIIYFIFENFSDYFLSKIPIAQSYNTELTATKTNILETNTLIVDGIKLIFYIIVGVTILSTAFSPTNLFMMVEHFIFLVVISAILTYLFGVMFNAFSFEFSKPQTGVTETIYSRILSSLSDFSIVFSNLNLLFIGNILAVIINVLMPKYGGGRVSQFYSHQEEFQ